MAAYYASLLSLTTCHPNNSLDYSRTFKGSSVVPHRETLSAKCKNPSAECFSIVKEFT